MAPTLSGDAGSRAASEIAGLAFGTLAAVITARYLGAAGKGVAAALTFIATLGFRLASVGLGEAGIVVVGRGRTDMAQALATNLALVLGTGVIAGGAAFLAASLVIGPSDTNTWLAVGVAAATVPLGALREILGQGLIMRQRIVESSAMVALISGTTVAFLAFFVIGLKLGLLGAMLAATSATLLTIVVNGRLLSADLPLRPRWNRRYAAEALRYGARLEASNLITVSAGRLDLLIVFALASEAAAGSYSVALTIAAIAATAPFALSYASFPRLAYSDAHSAAELTAAMWRTGLVAAILTSVVLALAAAVLIPTIFGTAFRPAIDLTLLLLPGSVVFGGQWLLARAAAAAGNTMLVLGSFATSLLSMVALDLLLIPSLGAEGAAVASSVSNLLGLAVCLPFHMRHTFNSYRQLAPTLRDCILLGSTAKRFARTLSTRFRPR